MTWRDDIKNKISQIENNDVTIINNYPTEDNFSKSKYRKSWVTAIFIDIVGYTNFCENSNDEKIGKVLKTFHEGILMIMHYYDLDHIDIQGDGIFGVLPSPEKNDVNDAQIFNAALEINGYLSMFWDELDFKISIATNEELMIVVGGKDTRKVVFAGGAVNKAKKLIDHTNVKNIIIIDSLFIENSEAVTFDEGIFGYDSTSYNETYDGLGYYLSDWYISEW